MLNGVAPILIFKFPLGIKIPVLSGIPLLGDLINDLGIPLPVYLDERLTGIYVTSQEKSIDMDTQPEQSADGKVKVTQRGVANQVTVNMLASRNSVVLSVLLAFADEIFKRAVRGNYSVTYLNGATLIFGGMIHSFSAQEGENDDLIRIAMTIQKTNQQTTTTPEVPTANAQAGTIAGPTGIPGK